MKAAAALAGVVALGLISACTPALDRGIVQGKDFSPGGCSTSFVSIPTGNGGTTMIPQTTCWNDDWVLHLKDEADGKTGDASVSESAYEKCQVGEKYPECSLE